MKRVTKQARKYIILLTVIAAVLIIWSLSTIKLGRISAEAKIGFLIFLAMASFLELTAVELSPYGYFSMAFGVYFACIGVCDFAPAVLLATIALGLKEILTNKQILWLKLADFSTTIIEVCLSGIIYSVINRGSPLFSLLNVLALALAGVSYYGLNFIFQTTVSGLMKEDVQKEYEPVSKRMMMVNLATVPLGFLILLAFKHNMWFALISIVPLYIIRQNVPLALKEMDLVNQQELLSKIETLTKEVQELREKENELNLELEKKIDEQSILMEMGEALGTSIDLESTLEIVVSMIRKLVIYQSCVIFLIEEGTLVAVKSVTPYRDMLAYSALLKLEESIVNLVVHSKKPIFIPDMQSMSDQRIFKDERSVICVPLIVKNEIIGVIYVGNPKPGTYNEEHLHLLSILGNAASNAIRTAQLYDQVEQKNIALSRTNMVLDNKVHSFKMLLDLGQKLGSSLNIEETRKIIIDNLEKMFRYQSAVLFEIKEEGKEKYLVTTKCRSPYASFFENMKLTMKDTSNIIGQIAKYRKPLLLPDTRRTKIKTFLKEELSIMVFPMIVENEIIGAIYLGHPSPNYFDEEAFNLMQAVSYNAAMAIKNAERYEEAYEKSITDGLTGLYTHRYFKERLTQAIAETKRTMRKIALIMVDADHFKTLNDTLGHPEGDKCLKTIAAIMRKYTRDSDLVCRVGGDEFTIMLMDIDKETAYKKAEAIRRTVEATFKDHPVQITTSIGLAVFPQDGKTLKDLIAAADAALYVSKKEGRNKVTVAKGPISKDFKKEALPRD